MLHRCFCLALLAHLAIGGATLPRPPAAVKVLDIFYQLQSAEEQKKLGRAAPHVAFELSEKEINEYSTYTLANTPRPGVQSISVKVFPNNYISTLTMMDFDAVERFRPGVIPTLLKPVLTGKKTIWIDFRFQAVNGRTTYSIEKAYFQNVRIPAFVISEMIQVVGARQPEHYDTSKPVPLPFGLQKIWTKDHSVLAEN